MMTVRNRLINTHELNNTKTKNITGVNMLACFISSNLNLPVWEELLSPTVVVTGHGEKVLKVSTVLWSPLISQPSTEKGTHNF